MTPPPLDPSDQDASQFREGDEVSVTLFDNKPTPGTVEHVYDDGGHRIKAGPALWIYLPPASTALSVSIPDEELPE